MPSRSVLRAFLALYATLGVVILIESVETVFAAYSGKIPPPDKYHALILGTIEMLAAIAFLIPKTMRIGAIALLVIFVIAFGLHALRGNLNLALLVYAAGVFFVQAHGIRNDRVTGNQGTD